MSFLQSLAKSGSSSNSNRATQNSHIWADRLTNDASSSSSQHQDFRTPAQESSSSSTGQTEYTSFLDESSQNDSSIAKMEPYTVLQSETSYSVDKSERLASYSEDIEFQQSIDGMDVLGLLEVMDTQEIEMDAFAFGRGGEKMLDDGEEVEDPVAWLDTTKDYADEVWGDDEPSLKKGKGKIKAVEKRGKGKGKGKAVDMKSRL
ncbi:hypothetical protein ABW21_db0208893 [Orbilia brochopaga]|nr:hypothetical protein ABW21_db0208893 [Drechslerella brochopaga]